MLPQHGSEYVIILISKVTVKRYSSYHKVLTVNGESGQHEEDQHTKHTYGIDTIP